MKKLALLLAFFTFGLQVLLAQTKEISGTVTSADDGSSIPGVSVSVKGTSLGTITDFEGKYIIRVPQNATTLVFSFVGMKTQEQPISGTSINVQLGTDMIGVDEVVVVGYGTTTKQSFAGSVKTIKNENIQSKSVSNVSQSLAGEAAGVRVINTSGQPGTTATIRIRGFGSVNGNRDPLYVLDGVPFSGSLNSINPNDIESTTILKDATATAIYGSRGANGVILLTTKSGKAGTSAIEVDIKTGVNVSGLPRYSTIKSPEEYIELSWEALYNKGIASNNADPVAYANNTLFSASGITPKYNLWKVQGTELIDPETRKIQSGVSRKYDPENWEDYGFQNSSRTEVNLTFRGGSETSKYYTSFGYLNDVGYIINSDFKRYNTTMNLESLVKPWLSTTAKLTVAGTETTNNGQSSDSGSIFWFVDNMPPIFPLFLRDEDGAIVDDPIFGGNQYDYGVGRAFGALTNSIADAHFDLSQTKQYQGSGNFGGTIRFTDNLTFENTFGVQYYSRKFNSLNNPFYGSSAGQGGAIFKRNTQLIAYNFLSLLRYKQSFDSHNLEALIAHESNSWESKIETMSKHKMVHPDIDDLNNFIIVSSPPTSYTDQVRLESYFGQVNYNFENKYFLTTSIRRDGSSRFIGDNKWDNFGSLGLSWVLTEESFMQNLPLVNFLKYKISYGVVGEQEGIGYYPAFNTFDVSNLNDGISISSRDIGNPDLTWETAKIFQTGVEFGIGRFLEGSFEYYVKNTDNLIFDRRVGPSVGYALIRVNDGILRNSAFEFDLTAHIIKKKDYSLNFTINGDMLSSKLMKMPIDPATGEPKVLDINDRFGRAEGHSLYDFYLREWAGVDPSNGTTMWYQHYHDANGNGILDSGEGISSLFEYTKANPDNEISVTTTKTYANATQKYVNKSAIPKVQGAFRLDGKVKDFDITALFIYSLGGYAYDVAYANLMSNDDIGNNNWSTDIRKRWQKPGDITDVPRLSSNYDLNVVSSSSRFITKSDFLALNNIQIGYNVPKQITDKLKMSSLNVFVSGDNLFLLSARKGFNPSTNEAGTSDMYRYSPLSTYTIGLRVKF
ncbi:MAG: SusC/RagA family TonB-linked outer membrane protein [Prolixibacteraceae bacterium]|jgi:TonB-linked SusC/RagA family outer membrane protein|nr:SusC/RagA family TonB-linked outer membrane protein [Prolixibacteraceae bacterium]